MDLSVGNIVTGKVTTITKFGAFVDLGNGKTGMVHISEVAPVFVKEIRDFVTEGQTVKVKIIGINEDGTFITEAEAKAYELSDFISFHSYSKYEKFLTGIYTLKKYFRRPIIVTEWLNREYTLPDGKTFQLYISYWAPN